MKKAFAIILTLVMALSFASCINKKDGESGKASAPSGKYILFAAEAEGEKIEGEGLTEIGFIPEDNYIEFTSDTEVTISYFGIPVEGTYVIDGEKIEMDLPDYGPDGKMTAIFKGDTIELPDEGATLYFEKE
ncbi:MAG: hypothetical protein LBS19_00560 [Clostridiales bacterium]|jgi:hypothetical protein|nr:hypothetical protein [Clostridiales bacterium]